MNQLINEAHNLDENANPTGGHTTGTGIDIQWQNGPLAVDGNRKTPNGAFVEGVIAAAVGRLEHYQASKFRCRENALAITKLQEALMWLQWRTRDRESQGIAQKAEGTHGVRPSEG